MGKEDLADRVAGFKQIANMYAGAPARRATRRISLPLNRSETHQLMVRLLKGLSPADQLLDRVRIIAGIEPAQLQIGIENTHTSYGAIKVKLDFRRCKSDVPMRFKRHRAAELGARSIRSSTHEDISPMPNPSFTLQGCTLPSR